MGRSATQEPDPYFGHPHLGQCHHFISGFSIRVRGRGKGRVRVRARVRVRSPRSMLAFYLGIFVPSVRPAIRGCKMVRLIRAGIF